MKKADGCFREQARFGRTYDQTWKQETKSETEINRKSTLAHCKVQRSQRPDEQLYKLHWTLPSAARVIRVSHEKNTEITNWFSATKCMPANVPFNTHIKWHISEGQMCQRKIQNSHSSVPDENFGTCQALRKSRYVLYVWNRIFHKSTRNFSRSCIFEGAQRNCLKIVTAHFEYHGENHEI